MELADFKNAIRTLDAAQLRLAYDFADANYEAVLPTLRTIVADAAASHDAYVNADDRAQLEFALLILAAKKQKDVFPEVYRLARQNNLADGLPEDCWLFRDLHRLFGILSDPDDFGAIGDLVLDPAICTPVREQALLSYHFLWIEKLIPEKDIIDEYRRLLEQGLAPEDDWKLWMALVINAAVVGGTKLKPQVMAILDSGSLSDQTSFVRKVVNGLFNNGNFRFREMLRREHKGYYENIDEEITAYITPPKDDDLEMPAKGKPQVREEPKIGRNDPCPCGSGKKYKKCCGAGK